MLGQPGLLVVSQDLAIKGRIGNCREAEIYGYLEGELTGGSLRVHRGGRFFGTARVESADIEGDIQGDLHVTGLMTIRGSGGVTGSVRYGQLAMEAGARLSANVRNLPPQLGGDLSLSVDRGRSVGLTLEDLTARDPDDTAENLVFAVSRVTGGAVIMAGAPGRPIAAFTQSDLERGRVAFMHDGAHGGTASFDVIVADAQGATSGEARTVAVEVIAGR